MKKKLLFFDVETTGRNPVAHDVVQFSALVVVGDKVTDSMNIKIKPYDFTTIQQEALNVTGLTEADLYNFTQPRTAHAEIVEFFQKHINKYMPEDKFIPVAYNGHFDLQFMAQFFQKSKDKFFGSWQNWQLIDVLPLVRTYALWSGIKFSNFKLENVCEYFQIPIRAHDAMSDVEATYRLYCLLKKLMYNKPKLETERSNDG